MHVRGPRCTSCSIHDTGSVRQYKRAQSELCKFGLKVWEACQNIAATPSRSLLSGSINYHERHDDQPSRCLETNMEFRRQKVVPLSLNRFPRFVPVSASTTESYLSPCMYKSDRRRPTTARPLPSRRGMPPTWISSGYYYFRQADQASSSYEDSRAPHSRMEQDMYNRRGQRRVRSSKGAREKKIARSTKKKQQVNALRPGPRRVCLHHR